MRNPLALTYQTPPGMLSQPILSGCLALAICFPFSAAFAPAQTAPAAPAQKAPEWTAGHVIVNPAVRFDQSKPLTDMATMWKPPAPPDRPRRPAGAAPPGA